MREWTPTSEWRRRSDTSQGRHGLPFYSSTVTTIGLHLVYARDVNDEFGCMMIISVAALLSAIRPISFDFDAHPSAVRSGLDVPSVPWVDWGPSCTHISHRTSQTPAGPFWIAIPERSVIRDYDPLRVRYAQSKMDPHQAVDYETEMYNEYFKDSKVETYLPYNEMQNETSRDLSRFQSLLANREWIVGSASRPEVRDITLLPSGQSLIIHPSRTRKRELLLQCIT